MIGKLSSLAAMAAAVLTLAARDVSAENISIYQATLAESGQKTQEVNTEQMRRILVDGSATVLDTRSRAEFEAGHIPGARNVAAAPNAQVVAVERLVNGDKNASLVLYCNGPYCQASRRLAEQLTAAGFTNVRRYQLGIPVWRALGGPTAVELAGIVRIVDADKTAVFIDVRTAEDFVKGSISRALNAPIDDVASGKLKKVPLPEDDFNRRIVLFGRDAQQARKMAEMLAKRPWHNVMYFTGSFDTIPAAMKTR